MSTPKTMLQSILEERNERYGDFLENAQITQALKAVIATRDLKLSDDQREALGMICHKISRILIGDPNYVDSWQDIAGYAQLVADRLNGVVR